MSVKVQFESFIRNRVAEVYKAVDQDEIFNEREDIIHKIKEALQKNGQEELVQQLNDSQFKIDDLLFQSIYIQGMIDAQELPIFESKIPQLKNSKAIS